jgi:hypothetical protein
MKYNAVWLMYQALPIINKKNIYADSFSSLPFSYYDFVKVTFYMPSIRHGYFLFYNLSLGNWLI